MIDLGLSAWFANWRDAAFVPGSLTTPPEPLAALRHDLRTNRERLLSLSPIVQSTRHRQPFGRPRHLDAAPLNLSGYWGVPNAHGYTPLAMKRHQELVQEALPSLYQGKTEELFAIRYFMAPIRTRKSSGMEWDKVPLRTPSLAGFWRSQGSELCGATCVGQQSWPDRHDRCRRPPTRRHRDGRTGGVDSRWSPATDYFALGEHLAEFVCEQTNVWPLAPHRIIGWTDALQDQDTAGKPCQGNFTVAFFPLGQRTTVTGVQLRAVRRLWPEHSASATYLAG